MSTPAFVKRAGARGQGGSVVVQLALTLGMMLALLAAPFVMARALLEINVTQRAVGNATRIAATHPLFQRTRTDVNYSTQPTATVAAAMAAAGMIAPGADIGELEIHCDVPRISCRTTLAMPEMISGQIMMDFRAPNASYSAATFFVVDRYAHGGAPPW
jgi:hypothetical protein